MPVDCKEKARQIIEIASPSPNWEITIPSCCKSLFGLGWGWIWVFCFLTLWSGLPVLTPCYLTAATKHNHKSHGECGCRKIYRGFFIWEHKCYVMLFPQTGFWKCFWHWIFFTSLSVQCEGVQEYLPPLHGCLVFLTHFFISQADFWDHVYLLHEQLLRWINMFRQIGRRALMSEV